LPPSLMKSATNPRLHSAEHSKNLSVARRANGDQCLPEQEYPRMSALGLVSRVTSVQTALRNGGGNSAQVCEKTNEPEKNRGGLSHYYLLKKASAFTLRVDPMDNHFFTRPPSRPRTNHVRPRRSDRRGLDGHRRQRDDAPHQRDHHRPGPHPREPARLGAGSLADRLAPPRPADRQRPAAPGEQARRRPDIHSFHARAFHHGDVGGRA